MSEIAIISSSIDEPTYAPIAEKLSAHGYDPWLYLSDRVTSGHDILSISLEGSGGMQVLYNNQEIFLEDIQAAWYRHPQLVGIDIPDKGRQMCLEREVTDLQDSLWSFISERAWLNSPYRMEKAKAKLAQLALASELGFEVPDTVISNGWEKINEVLSKDNKDVTLKMSKGLLYEENNTKVLYATRLGSDDLRAVQVNSSFPGIYQQYINKRREWRITAVGEAFFDAAIYTTEAAKDDWRKHQLTDRVLFKREDAGDDVHELCARYLSHCGLVYGAFDLIESNDGRITFLECNSNGQFRWLEDALDLPISSAIVDTLIKKVEG